MIRFACPHCQKTYTVPVRAGGKPSTCTRCQAKIRIPPAPEADYEEVPDDPPPPAVDPHAVTQMELALPDPPALPPPYPAVAGPSEAVPDPRSETPATSGVEPPATVELQPCPKCAAQFTILADDLGAMVECTSCQTVFLSIAAPRRPTVVTPISLPPLSPPTADPPVARRASTVAPPADEGKKRPYEFKEKRRKPGSPFLDDDEDDDRPRRRRSRRDRDRDDDDRDDDDEDDRPRRKKRKPARGLRDDRYRSYSNHDGVLLLVVTLVCFFVNGFGFLCCMIGFFVALPLNVYVLIKSSLSIREIKNGTMDPDGRALLEVARVLAILQIIGFVVWFVLWLVGMVVFANKFTPPPDRIPGGDGFEIREMEVPIDGNGGGD